MAEDRGTGAPVLSATGSYVENIPGAESPVIRSDTIFGNFFASDASKGRFSAEKSSVNPLDRLFSEHLQLSNMDIILCMRS